DFTSGARTWRRLRSRVRCDQGREATYMQTVAHYALLGSLVAGAAGVLVLTIVTLKHGLRRRVATAEGAIEPQPVLRPIRPADPVAVLSFAVAAGLGVFGLMQQTRTIAAAGSDGRVAQRLDALEQRMARAEHGLAARQVAIAEPKAWDERLTRVERRLVGVEHRAAYVEQLSRERRDERLRTAPVATSKRVPVPPPRLSPAPPVPAASPSPLPRVNSDAASAPQSSDAGPSGSVAAAPSPSPVDSEPPVGWTLVPSPTASQP